MAKICLKCNKEWPDEFMACPLDGTTLVLKQQQTAGFSLNLGDANAISGGINMSDNHSINNTTTSSVDSHNVITNNITHVERDKTPEEMKHEKEQYFREECLKVYSNGIVTSVEKRKLEDLQYRLGLDENSTNRILSEVAKRAERKSSSLSPVHQITYNNIKTSITANRLDLVNRLMAQMRAMVRRYSVEEIQFTYFMLQAVLHPKECAEEFESNYEDKYWQTFWASIAYRRIGNIEKSELLVADVGEKWIETAPQENVFILASMNALIDKDIDTARSLYDNIRGEHSSCLSNISTCLYSLLYGDILSAEELERLQKDGAFYLQNLFPEINAFNSEKRKLEENEKNRHTEEKPKQENAKAKRNAEEKPKQKDAKVKCGVEEKPKQEEAKAKRNAEEKPKQEEAKAKRNAEEKPKQEEAKAKRNAEEKPNQKNAKVKRDVEGSPKKGKTKEKSLTEAMKQQKDSEVQRQAEKSQTEGVVSGAEGDDEIKNEISTSDDDIQVGKANVFLKKGQYKEAVKIYKKIAMKGNAYAQGIYGNCLLHGWGVKQNMAKGIEWLEKSASQKGAWPCLKLAWVFLGYDFNGKRITLDNQKAKEYISKAKKYGGGDDGEISALEEAAARSVIVTNTKVIKDVKCNGKRGVVIELKMVAHGMRGRRLNFSAYTALLEDEFLKPGDLEFMSPDAPPQCCFVEIICPPKKVSVWHKYALFISYEDIYDHTFPNEIERLVLAAWDQTNENDVQLLCCKELGSFSLSFKRHTFRSNEWFFTFSEK